MNKRRTKKAIKKLLAGRHLTCKEKQGIVRYFRRLPAKWMRCVRRWGQECREILTGQFAQVQEWAKTVTRVGSSVDCSGS